MTMDESEKLHTERQHAIHRKPVWEGNQHRNFKQYGSHPKVRKSVVTAWQACVPLCARQHVV